MPSHKLIQKQGAQFQPGPCAWRSKSQRSQSLSLISIPRLINYVFNIVSCQGLLEQVSEFNICHFTGSAKPLRGAPRHHLYLTLTSSCLSSRISFPNHVDLCVHFSGAGPDPNPEWEMLSDHYRRGCVPFQGLSKLLRQIGW